MSDRDPLGRLYEAERARVDEPDARREAARERLRRRMAELPPAPAAPRSARGVRLASGLVGLCVGAVAGFVAGRATVTPRVELRERVVVHEVVRDPLPVMTDAGATTDADADAEVSSVHREVARARPTSSDDGLTFIAAAQSALAHDNPADALRLLAEHAARHPRSALSEERDALRVRALSRLGREREARAAAARFHRAHPSSALGAGVDADVNGR